MPSSILTCAYMASNLKTTSNNIDKSGHVADFIKGNQNLYHIHLLRGCAIGS